MPEEREMFFDLLDIYKRKETKRSNVRNKKYIISKRLQNLDFRKNQVWLLLPKNPFIIIES